MRDDMFGPGSPDEEPEYDDFEHNQYADEPEDHFDPPQAGPGILRRLISHLGPMTWNKAWIALALALALAIPLIPPAPSHRALPVALSGTSTSTPGVESLLLQRSPRAARPLPFPPPLPPIEGKHADELNIVGGARADLAIEKAMRIVGLPVRNLEAKLSGGSELTEIPLYSYSIAADGKVVYVLKGADDAAGILLIVILIAGLSAAFALMDEPASQGLAFALSAEFGGGSKWAQFTCYALGLAFALKAGEHVGLMLLLGASTFLGPISWSERLRRQMRIVLAYVVYVAAMTPIETPDARIADAYGPGGMYAFCFAALAAIAAISMLMTPRRHSGPTTVVYPPSIPLVQNVRIIERVRER